MGALPEMTEQRPVPPLPKIVLRARQSVIDPQDCAVLKRTGDRKRPIRKTRTVLRRVALVPSAGGLRERPADLVERARRGACCPDQPIVLDGDAQFLASPGAPAKARHRQ